MTNTKSDDKGTTKGIHPVVAGAVGAAVGATAAVVATAAMKDEKTRARVKKVLTTVREQAMDYVDKMQKQVPEQSKKLIEQGTEKAHQMLEASSSAQVGKKLGRKGSSEPKQPKEKEDTK